MPVIPTDPTGLGIWPGMRYAGALFVTCINRSAGELSGGDVVCLATAAAYAPDGCRIGVATTEVATDDEVLGVVADGQVNVPNGAPVIVQIAGLHPAVNVTGSEATLNPGDMLGTAATAKYGAKVLTAAHRVGYYVDAAYSGATVKKKVFLTNPLGIKPD